MKRQPQPCLEVGIVQGYLVMVIHLKLGFSEWESRWTWTLLWYCIENETWLWGCLGWRGAIMVNEKGLNGYMIRYLRS